MLQPQPGRQTQFLSSPADITVYGGAAGGGKSFGLLLEATRNAPYNKEFAAVIFRRTTTDIRKPGALWDQSFEVFGQFPGAKPSEQFLEWHFMNGGKVRFDHLEHDKTVLSWHGAQVPLICFDELTTFTQKQFFYMVSRNRSTCGVRPYICATTNPDADSWVASFISWWINQETGFPIAERAGATRWFLRVGDELVWADSPDQLSPSLLNLPLVHAETGEKIDYMPKSVSFIPATLKDNQILMAKDPGYMANLLSMATVERERLLQGNWKIKPAAGLLFQRGWCELIKEADLPQMASTRRGWDLAATPKTQMNDPDWTCGTKIGKGIDGYYYVLDHVRFQGTPETVQRIVRNTGLQDGLHCMVCVPQDPGQAGKSQVAYLTAQLDGLPLQFTPEQGDKITRFSGFSAQAQAGRVRVLEAPWNQAWFANLEGFPDLPHDDDADSTSRAFAGFYSNVTGLLDFYTSEALRIRQDADKAKASETVTAKNGVKVKGPPNVNVLYGMKGETYYPDAKGVFLISETLAGHLRRSKEFTFL